MLSIFQYDFMIRAFLAGAVIAITAPLIGIFLVAKRYSTLADTLAHVSLMGVAAGALFGFNPVLGALAASVVASLGMEELRRTKKFFSESVLALFLSGSLTVALILFAISHGLNANIFAYLFGSITTVSGSDVMLITVLGILVTGTAILLFKQLFIASYDEELAEASGMPVRTLNIILILMAAASVSVGMRAAGALLSGALMVIPVLTASQFNKGFAGTTIISTGLSFVAVMAGLFASFYLNLPSGGAIVAVALIFFAVSLVRTK